MLGTRNSTAVTADDQDIRWMDEPANGIGAPGWLKFLVRLFVTRKRKSITYKEYFLILYGLNRGKLGDRTAKERAMRKILEIYYKNNKKYPEIHGE